MSSESLIKGRGYIVAAGIGIINNCSSCSASVSVAISSESEGDACFGLTPPGYPGSDRIKVLFRVDEQRFLGITVEDLLTNETLLEDKPMVQLS
jgi:hypothetical protein